MKNYLNGPELSYQEERLALYAKEDMKSLHLEIG